jgi:hypothetical protein
MTQLIKAILEFIKGLHLKTVTQQEPPRPNPQDTASGIVAHVEKEPEAPQEVVAQPPKDEPAPVEPEKLLWCPFAVRRKEKMTVRGKYRKGYPEGAVIHFTAGSSAEGSFQHGLKENFCFFVIHEDGTIWQSFPLDSWGYHAGESFHPKLGKGVSRYLVGIEVSCAGGLTKAKDGSFESWFGRKVPSSQVRSFPKKTGNILAGHYAIFTAEQERSLKKLLQWLKNNNPEVFTYDLVVGHDEVAPNRKNDPGGALSMTMDEFRTALSQG